MATSITVTDAQGSGTTSDTQNFTLSIGVGDGTRRLVVGAGGRSQATSTGKVVNSITLDGVSMTLISGTSVTLNASVGSSCGSAIFQLMASALPDPTVTSVACVVTYGGTGLSARSGASIAVIPAGLNVRVYDVATGTADGGVGGSASLTADVNNPAFPDVAPGGSTFAVGLCGVGTPAAGNYTWTGQTEAFDIQTGAANGRFTSAALSNGSAELNRTVTLNGTGGASTWFDMTVALVSFRSPPANLTTMGAG